MRTPAPPARSGAGTPARSRVQPMDGKTVRSQPRPIPPRRPGFTPQPHPRRTSARPIPPRRRRRWWWGTRFPLWDHDWAVDVYNASLSTGLSGLTESARRSLWRSGLLSQGWVYRLRQAPESLIQFIRRFHNITGFEHTVKAFFGNTMQKRAALMSIKLIRSLVQRIPDYSARMLLTQAIGYAPHGAIYLTPQLELDGRHYIFLPWVELDERTVRRQFACDQQLFDSPETVRWVLSSKALRMQQDEVAERVQNLLEMTSANRDGNAGNASRSRVVVLP